MRNTNKMARLILSVVLCVVMTFSLVSCVGEDNTVGIIGGADGPTAIFVASSVGDGIAVNGNDTTNAEAPDVQDAGGNLSASTEGADVSDSENGGADEPFIVRLYARGVLQFFDGTPSYVPTMIVMYLLAALIAYSLGSLNFGIIISKLVYHDDIRKYGSGNAGTTNMLRTFGKGAAVGTIVGDALKVVFAIVIANLLLGTVMGGGYVAGLCAIVGHVYPAFYGFKGGKGVVTAAITMLMLNPVIFAVEITAFVIIVAIWRYISLGSIICAALYPMITYAAYGPSVQVIFALLIAVFIIILHRTNIQRLIDGKENKLSFTKSGKKSAHGSDDKK